MKKIKNLLMISTLLMTIISFSQNEFSIGLNGGITYSKIRGNQLANQNDSAIDFLIGFGAEFPLNKNLSIKTNLNYERKTVSTINPSFERILIKSTFSYISLPILAKYSFGNSNNFYINGGPFLAFLLNSKSKASGYPDSDTTDLNNSTDIGLTLGVGKKINVSDKSYLDLEIRNNLGLTNIGAVKTINNGALKTNSINIILAYYFSL